MSGNGHRDLRRLLKAAGVVLAGTALFFAYLWLHTQHPRFELPKTAILKGRNIAWENRVGRIDNRLDQCERALADLQVRDERIYRSVYGMESIPDTARVLGRLYDGIEYRGYSQALVEELAQYAGVPVWNGLTDQFHPTQMLADLLTLEEKFGHLKGLRFTYMGDARNNMGNSLMIACAKMGLHFTACAPKELFPAAELVEKARAIAAETGGSVRLTEDVAEGAADADVIYTDIWVSMGEPDEVWESRIRLLTPYQVNAALMARAKPTAVFMHCLPSFHDTRTVIGAQIAERFGLKEMEVTDEVFESKQSVVFDEAENRMHTIKAVLYATLC